MDLYAFSIGQADSLLLLIDGRSVLIDAGEEDDADEITSELAALGVEKLDLLIITHFDKDHIGSADAVADLLPIDTIYLPDYERDSKRYRTMMDAFATNGAKLVRVSADTELTLGEARFSFWPSTLAYDGKNDNALSLVFRMEYGERSFLFLGDAEGAWLNALCYGNYNLTADVMKIPHHGEWDACSFELIAYGLPGYAIITDSNKNPASDELLNALSLIDANTLETRYGRVHLHCDGKEIAVVQD